MLSFPPTNHVEWGGFHSSTLSHFLYHASSFACASQNASGFSAAASYIALSETCAPLRNESGGEKERCSWRRASISDIGLVGLCHPERSEGSAVDRTADP